MKIEDRKVLSWLGNEYLKHVRRKYISLLFDFFSPPSYEALETGHSQRQGREIDKSVVWSDMANWQFLFFFFYICFQSSMDMLMKECLDLLNEWLLMYVCTTLAIHFLKESFFKKNVYIFGFLERLVQGMCVCVCVCVCERERERERKNKRKKEAFKEFKIDSTNTVPTFLPFLSSLILSSCLSSSG